MNDVKQTKTLYVCEFPPKKFYEFGISDYEKIRLLGLNSGNLVYTQELRKQIKSYKEGWFNLCQNDTFDVGILPASCQIAPWVNDLVVWAELIKDVKFPVTLCGLGAQSSFQLNTPKKLVNQLSSEQVNAIKTISTHCVSIGIRGEFTAECLEQLGVKNYRIIGCPSFYSCRNEIDKMIAKEVDGDSIGINLNIDRRKAPELLDFAMKNNCDYFMQAINEIQVLDCFINGRVDEIKYQRIIPYQEYIKNHAKVYTDINEWSEAIRGKDFLFGMRFHGNMLALLNGVPALWIAHDSRTRELCKALYLPFVDYDELPFEITLDWLRESCTYSETKKKFDELLDNYMRYLNENDISINYEIFK